MEDPLPDPLLDPVEDPLPDPLLDPVVDPVEDPLLDPVEDPPVEVELGGGAIIIDVFEIGYAITLTRRPRKRRMRRVF